MVLIARKCVENERVEFVWVECGFFLGGFCFRGHWNSTRVSGDFFSTDSFVILIAVLPGNAFEDSFLDNIVHRAGGMFVVLGGILIHGVSWGYVNSIGHMTSSRGALVCTLPGKKADGVIWYHSIL